MRMDAQAESLMRQLIARADAAAANPAAVLFGTFEGRSRAGNVTVRVDALGRLVGVSIAADSVGGGDEESVAAALMEAYTAARANAENLVLEESSNWQNQIPGGRQTSTAASRSQSGREDDGDDNRDFTVLRRY